MGHLVKHRNKTENTHGQAKHVLSYSHVVCLNSYHYLDSVVNFPTPLYKLSSFLLFTPNHPIRQKMFPAKRIFLFPRTRQSMWEYSDTKFNKGYQANCAWKLPVMFSSGIETTI